MQLVLPILSNVDPPSSSSSFPTPSENFQRKENPYPKFQGFGKRMIKAKNALEKFGRNRLHTPYTRAFDNCFEMYDGSAVVFELIDQAINGNNDLRQGIQNMGKGCWNAWMKTYSPKDSEAAKE